MVVFPRTTTAKPTSQPRVPATPMSQPPLPSPVAGGFATQRRRCRQGLGATALALCLTLSIVTATFAQSCPLYSSPHQRIGFNVAPDNGVDIDDYDAAQLGAGWYHNYSTRVKPHQPGGIQFHQMVRSKIDRTRLPELLGPKVRSNPGALWILGNEPDHYGQDGLTPAQYASFYHQLYTYIRSIDPTSRIAIAGIVQPTPIRLRYLDMMLASYQQQYGTPMPVDIWDIHNFILPENCGWGASIPPGLQGYMAEAVPCPPSFDDHGNITIFQEQIRTFRRWMKTHGFRDTPLIVSEYGILLSKYHGYDHPRVREFMRNSFDFMLNATDSQLGYPADGNRLVQEFAWFSLNYWEFDIKTYFGLNGNLFDHDSAQIMPLGRDFAAYTNAVTIRTIDLALRDIRASAGVVNAYTPVTFDVAFANQGGVAAQDVAVQFWQGNPNAGGTLLGTSPVEPQLLANCSYQTQASYQWTPTQGGVYTIYAALTASNLDQEVDLDNNYASLAVVVKNVTPTPVATVTPGGPTVTPTLMPTAPTATPTPIQPPTPTATLIPTAIPSAEATLLVDPLRTGTLTIQSADGARVRVTIPAGTLDQPTTLVLRALTVLPSTARTLTFAGRAFQLEAFRDGNPVTALRFATPILVTLDYLDSDLAAFDEAELMLYAYDETAADWGRAAVTLIRHDLAANQLVVSYSDGDRAPAAARAFALFVQATPTATPTATPVGNGTPTPTATPPLTQFNSQIYLPLISTD